KIGIYGRVSRSDGVQDVQNQLHELRAWAARLGGEVVAEYIELAASHLRLAPHRQGARRGVRLPPARAREPGDDARGLRAPLRPGAARGDGARGPGGELPDDDRRAAARAEAGQRIGDRADGRGGIGAPRALKNRGGAPCGTSPSGSARAGRLPHQGPMATAKGPRGSVADADITD